MNAMSKRLMDLFLACVALVLLCVPIILVYLLVRLTSIGPALY